MIKYFLALGFVFCSTLGLSAQSVVTFEHGKHNEFVMGHDGTTDCHVNFQNLTGNKIDLVYNKLTDDFPSKWWVSFCDNYNCFASFVPHDTFAPIANNGYSEFKISVTPNGFADTATVSYEIWTAADPGVKDTVTFVFMVQWGAKTHESGNIQASIYPNPAHSTIGVLGLVEPTEVLVMNVEGKTMVKSMLDAENNQIQLQGLAPGVYFVSYNSANGLMRGSFIKQ